MSTEDLHAIELDKDEVMDLGEDVVCFLCIVQVRETEQAQSIPN
jgi:hypothetical protein